MKVETIIKVDGKVTFEDTMDVKDRTYIKQYGDAVATMAEWLFFKAGEEGGDQ